MKNQAIFTAVNQADYIKKYRLLLIKSFLRKMAYAAFWVGIALE